MEGRDPGAGHGFDLSQAWKQAALENGKSTVSRDFPLLRDADSRAIDHV